MVDPHRKINILSEDQQNFIEDCEEEFRGRFTEDDEEFMAYCKKARPTPPIMDPWVTRRNYNQHRGGGGGGGDGGNHNRGHHHNRPYYHHGGGRNDRYHHRGGRHRGGGGGGYSGGGGGGYNQYSNDHNRKPYDR